jgi:hypothetical protein
MATTTPNRGYPVPEGSDPFEPRKWIEDLGQAVDADVEAVDARLPSGTVVGQVLIWNGTAWVPRATTATPTYADLAAGRVITDA